MAMKQLVQTRTYINKAGEKKTARMRVGTVFVNENGSQRLVIEPGLALLGLDDKNISYWIDDIEPRGEYGARRPQEKQPEQSPDPGADDDIPF